MLSFILGSAGAGKSARIFDDIANCVGVGENDKNCGQVYFIAPEQYSFESDRQLYAKLGAQGFNAVKSTSFTRIANEIFTAHGNLAGDYAQDSTKLLIMSLALTEVSGELRLYSRQLNNYRFCQTMLDAVTELKTAGVKVDDLSGKLKSFKGTLFHKAQELSLIYSTYNTILERSYKDSLDDITRAAMLAQETGYFQGAHIFIDEFKSFTGSELILLRTIISQAKQVTVSLCTEHVNVSGISLFSTVNQTYHKLRQIARDCETKIAPDTMLTELKRYKSTAIEHINSNIFRPRREAISDKSGDVVVCEASDVYKEAEYVAASIRKLVMEGYKYNEIAVIGRSLDSYKAALESSFDRYEIPYFLDNRDSVADKSIMLLVTSAFEAATWNTEAILRYIKTGLTGLDLKLVSELENFCFTWGVKGKDWLSDFTVKVDGIDKINTARRTIIEPLSRFRSATESATGAEITRALYKLLEDIDAPESVGLQCTHFADVGQLELSHELRQLWDILVDILESIHRILGETSMTRSKYLELIRLVIAQTTFASAPKTLDEVTVGSADRIRIAAPKAVFLIGVNEGVMPFNVRTGGIFSDKERNELAGQGIKLGENSIDRLNEERFIAYKAASTPSERLFVSYSLADNTYNAQLPSYMVDQICQMLDISPIKARDIEYTFYSTTSQAAFYSLAGKFREDNSKRASLIEALQDQPNIAQKITSLYHALNSHNHRIEDTDVATALFGNKMQLSATRVDDFHKCRFLYFCKAGLRLKPLRKMELSPLERGNVIHYCLSELMREHSEDFIKLTEDELMAITEKLLNEYLTQNMQGEFAKDAKFFLMYRRLCIVVVDIFQRLQVEFAQSKFVPCDFELEISPESDVTPLELKTVDGVSVNVRGIIDRVDIMEKDGKRYVRVVDYKSGTKDFVLSDIYYGLNMQMLLYLFAIQKSGKGRYKEVLPAGVLYMPASESKPTLDRDATDKDTNLERIKGYKMDGIIINDSDVINGMEIDANGVFIPIKKDKEGNFKPASKLIELEKLSKLQAYAERLMLQMAQSLTGGNIEALPVYGRGYEPCKYCDYRSVCGHDEKGKVRVVENIDINTLINKIELSLEDENENQAIQGGE